MREMCSQQMGILFQRFVCVIQRIKCDINISSLIQPVAAVEKKLRSQTIPLLVKDNCCIRAPKEVIRYYESCRCEDWDERINKSTIDERLDASKYLVRMNRISNMKESCSKKQACLWTTFYHLPFLYEMFICILSTYLSISYCLHDLSICLLVN